MVADGGQAYVYDILQIRGERHEAHLASYSYSPRVRTNQEAIMKKLILSAALLGSIAIAVPAAEARTSSTASVDAPQIRVQIGRNRRNFRRTRVVTSTRIVGFGRNRYRETIQTTYHANGRVTVRVISRQRIGWGRG
jgi:hypothetical protein